MDVSTLLIGMQLTDSALPTGAFAHSFGFESYQEDDRIVDADGFAQWLRSFTAQQLTYTDALAVRLVYAVQDFDEILGIDHLVTAQALPRQVREAGMTMGKRMLRITRENYPSPDLIAYDEAVAEHRAFSHPAIVWAIVARSAGFDLDAAIAHHVYASVIALTQNAVRAIPLGQNAGQRIVRQAQPWVSEAVEVSKNLQEEDLGAIAPGLEIAQMNHERQHSRLFMS